MLYRADGWRGVYVPRILALGATALRRAVNVCGASLPFRATGVCCERGVHRDRELPLRTGAVVGWRGAHCLWASGPIVCAAARDEAGNAARSRGQQRRVSEIADGQGAQIVARVLPRNCKRDVQERAAKHDCLTLATRAETHNFGCQASPTLTEIPCQHRELHPQQQSCWLACWRSCSSPPPTSSLNPSGCSAEGMKYLASKGAAWRSSWAAWKAATDSSVKADLKTLQEYFARRLQHYRRSCRATAIRSWSGSFASV